MILETEKHHPGTVDLLEILARADKVGCSKPFDILGITPFKSYEPPVHMYLASPPSKTD